MILPQIPDPHIGLLPGWIQSLLIAVATAGWGAALHMFWRYQEEKKAAANTALAVKNEAAIEDNRQLQMTELRRSVLDAVSAQLERHETRTNELAESIEQNGIRVDVRLAEQASMREIMKNELVSRIDDLERDLYGPQKTNGMRGHIKYLLDAADAFKIVLDRIVTKTKVKGQEIQNLRRQG